MINRRRLRQLGGETLREIGLLLIVFGPLDVLFQREQVVGGMLVAILAVGLIFTIVGIIIEAGEEQSE